MSAEQVGNMFGSLLITKSSKHWKEVGKYFFPNLTVGNISLAFELKLKPEVSQYSSHYSAVFVIQRPMKRNHL